MTATVSPIRPDIAEPETVTIPRLVTLIEAAPLLGKTESQLRWMVHVGTAPKSAMIGGRRMFRAADIKSYIDAAFADEAAS